MVKRRIKKVNKYHDEYENNARLSELLDKIGETKQKLDYYKKLYEKQRNQVILSMNNLNINNYQNTNYSVCRRNQITSRLSKSDVPIDIWERYSTSSRSEVVTIRYRK